MANSRPSPPNVQRPSKEYLSAFRARTSYNSCIAEKAPVTPSDRQPESSGNQWQQLLQEKEWRLSSSWWEKLPLKGRSYLFRQALIALLVLATPLVNDEVTLHPRPKSDLAVGGEYGHGDHEPGHIVAAALQDAHDRRRLDEHGGHAHHDTVVLDQMVSLAIVVVLVIVTIVFESTKERLEETMEKYKVILDRIWGEMTVLGFLALITFIMLQSHWLQKLSALVYGDDEHLVHLFEQIHFALFFVMVTFLTVTLWLLHAAASMERQWDEYEELIKAHVKGSQLMQAKHAAETGFTMCEDLLAAAETAAPPSCCRMLRLTAGSHHEWALATAKRRCVFQRMRQRFITLQSRADPKQALPADFEFSDYLLECIKESLAHTVHVGVFTWIRSIGVMSAVFAVAALAPHSTIWFLTAAGWLLYAQACLVYQHYQWVEAALLPVQSLDSAEEAGADTTSAWFPNAEVGRLAEPPSLWALAYRLLVHRDTAAFAKRAQGIGPRAHAGVPTAAPPHALRAEKFGGLLPGAFERLPLTSAHAEHGRTKHTALLWPRHPKPHSKSVEAMRHAAAEPIQLWLQANLLTVALYVTILVLFYSPLSAWDWRTALAIYPILNLMILQVPDMLPLMCVSLSIEMLSSKKALEKTLETMKLVKFARTAKLLQAMRSQAAALDASVRRKSVAKDLTTLLASLPAEKRTRAMQLKECFDVFDVSGEGTLTADEMEDVFRMAAIPLADHQKAQMMRVLDADGSGDISFVEFAEYMLANDDDDRSPEEIAEKVFEMLDTDGGGVIDTAELHEAFERMHTGLTLNELTQIINMFDVSGEGQIEKEEFVSLLARIMEDFNI